MPGGTLESLISLVRKIGRFPVTDSLTSLLQSIHDAAAARGYSENFAEQAVSGALGTADPQAALNRLARLLAMIDDPNFRSLLENPDGLKSLLAILGYSNFLSSLIQRSPGDYVWLMREVGLSGTRYSSAMHDDLTKRLPVGGELEDAGRILRVNKYREMLRIGVRDLLGAATLEETVHDISNLAEASIDASVEIAMTHLKQKHGVPLRITERGVTRPGKFCVLGMGKLGGEELNYSSDVDLFYLYSSHEGMTTGRPSKSGGYRDSVENHRFYVRLGETITRLLNERTADGIVFRVDLRLRPEGESGEIAYSLPSLDVYYQSWGRTMDRLALLKGKPVGGDRRLGEVFLESMIRFVYRRHLDYTAIEEIGVLKEKIHRQIDEEASGIRDIKLGRGGIRDIEFLIQSLQLIHGGRNPAIREKNSLRALDRLMKNGFLTERDAETLRESYIFLRTVEHRVQLVEERQTHTLPHSEDEISKLAYIMGFIRDGKGDESRFREALNRVTEDVRVCYDHLFFTEDVPRSSRDVPEPNLLREDLTEEEAVEELGSAGFSDPEAAYRNLLLLRDGPSYGHFTDTCRHLLRQIAPRLLAELKGVPDPDAVLVNLNRFIGKVGARASYYSMLARNPESIKLLASLFGSSPFLSGFLLRQPDLLDLMISGTDLSEGRSLEDLEEEIREILGPSPSFEDELIMLRRYRNGEILRIGLGDLLGLRKLPGVNMELTALAEGLLRASFDMAVRDVAVDRGDPPGSFGVVAMGKMGGREMNYSSDLDLVFLFQGGEGSREFYTRVAQRMITIITSPTGEGVLYRADMRLRPSGHAGPLVTTLDSFRRYHQEDAMVWERQALTKARWVAGDREFGGNIAGTIDELTYSHAIGKEEVREIRRVRDRMENEISGESSGQFHDIKVGKGGLVDIEFAVQVLQLYYGHDLPEVRTASTMEALKALKDSGLVEENQYNALHRAYIFFREIENRSQLYQDRSDPRIPADEKKVQPLARSLGYFGEAGSPADFLEKVRDTKLLIRSEYENLMVSIEKEND